MVQSLTLEKVEPANVWHFKNDNRLNFRLSLQHRRWPITTHRSAVGCCKNVIAVFKCHCIVWVYFSVNYPNQLLSLMVNFELCHIKVLDLKQPHRGAADTFVGTEDQDKGFISRNPLLFTVCWWDAFIPFSGKWTVPLKYLFLCKSIATRCTYLCFCVYTCVCICA